MGIGWSYGQKKSELLCSIQADGKPQMLQNRRVEQASGPGRLFQPSSPRHSFSGHIPGRERTRLFIHSLRQIFIEHLPCARHVSGAQNEAEKRRDKILAFPFPQVRGRRPLPPPFLPLLASFPSSHSITLYNDLIPGVGTCAASKCAWRERNPASAPLKR